EASGAGPRDPRGRASPSCELDRARGVGRGPGVGHRSTSRRGTRTMTRGLRILVLVAVACMAIGAPLALKHAWGSHDGTESFHGAPVASVPANVPTFIDIGTTTCIPCKAMLKIMA